MQLTKYTDISLRVLMHLAAFPNELGTVKTIAAHYNISQHHLVKVVHRLSGLGYLTSTKGRGGGIALGMPPENIVIGQVVRDMESTLEVVDCVKNDCPLISGCILKGILDEAMTAFIETLDNYTLADLIKNRSQIFNLIAIES